MHKYIVSDIRSLLQNDSFEIHLLVQTNFFEFFKTKSIFELVIKILAQLRERINRTKIKLYKNLIQRKLHCLPKAKCKGLIGMTRLSKVSLRKKKAKFQIQLGSFINSSKIPLSFMGSHFYYVNIFLI